MLFTDKNKKLLVTAFLVLNSLIAQADPLKLQVKEKRELSKKGHILLELGAYLSSSGKEQDISVPYLVGNHYTLKNNPKGNALLGLGYYFEGLSKEKYQLYYGVNGFYLFGTSVTGDIIQEQSYTNLKYDYTIEHLPLYLATKALIRNKNPKYNLIFDAGLGANVVFTSNYNETPLNSYTFPDNGFKQHTSATFSAMVGLGLRLNQMLGQAPIECGYRFFYLGDGQLSRNNDQLLSNLKTGNTYANAILCAITV